MKLLQGDIWEEVGSASLLLVTTNCSLNSRNELVMGRGIALQAKKRYPHLPKVFADRLLAMPMRQRFWYGMLEGVVDGKASIDAFQTKEHWSAPSTLDLVHFSLLMLKGRAFCYDRIVMPIPGTGNGGLRREQVLPLMERLLPDNVFVYER